MSNRGRIFIVDEDAASIALLGRERFRDQVLDIALGDRLDLHGPPSSRSI